MNCSKSASTAIGRVPACCSSCSVSARDQPLLEGSILPAAGHPDVAGAQPIAQFRQHAELVIAPVDGAARAGHRAPSVAGRSRSARISAGQAAGAVRLAQHLDGAHQRGAGGHALELERVQEGRRPATDAGVMLAEVLVACRIPPAGPAPRLPRPWRGTAPTGSPWRSRRRRPACHRGRRSARRRRGHRGGPSH